MNSYNHYAYGAVADWVYRYAAGIDTSSLEPGFRTIHLHPTFDAQLGQLDLSYESPYGTIRSAWKVNEATARWDLTIPANASGLLSLSREQSISYTLGGQPLSQVKGVQAVGDTEGEIQYEILAGTYHFIVNLHAK